MKKTINNLSKRRIFHNIGTHLLKLIVWDFLKIRFSKFLQEHGVSKKRSQQISISLIIPFPLHIINLWLIFGLKPIYWWGYLLHPVIFSFIIPLALWYNGKPIKSYQNNTNVSKEKITVSNII